MRGLIKKASYITTDKFALFQFNSEIQLKNSWSHINFNSLFRAQWYRFSTSFLSCDSNIMFQRLLHADWDALKRLIRLRIIIENIRAFFNSFQSANTGMKISENPVKQEISALLNYAWIAKKWYFWLYHKVFVIPKYSEYNVYNIWKISDRFVKTINRIILWFVKEKNYGSFRNETAA